jgi:hypothetical protein
MGTPDVPPLPPAPPPPTDANDAITLKAKEDAKRRQMQMTGMQKSFNAAATDMGSAPTMQKTLLGQ